MGHRLHYATRYDVQYSGGGFANYMQAEINYVLDRAASSVGCAICWGIEDRQYSLEFEIHKDDLFKIIAELKTWDDSQLDKTLIEEGVTINEIVLNLELALANSDKANDFIHFAWF